MSSALRSIRFLPIGDNKDRQRYSDGEVFYDRQANTLRVYDGNIKGGYKLATETYVNNVVDNIVVNAASWDIILNKPVFATVATSGSYNDLTNKPTIPSIAGLATETYVTTAISNIPAVDLTGYATETYVTTAIGNIPAPTALGFQMGVVVNEFSSDSTMTDNSSFSPYGG